MDLFVFQKNGLRHAGPHKTIDCAAYAGNFFFFFVADVIYGGMAQVGLPAGGFFMCG